MVPPTLVDPLDGAAIAAGIQRALSDETGTADLVARGQRRAAGATWAATADGYAALFHEVVGR